MPAQCCKEIFARVPDEEPVFTIRAHDKLAEKIVRAWLMEARAAGAPAAKLSLAEEHLRAIVDWRAMNADRVKVPD